MTDPLSTDRLREIVAATKSPRRLWDGEKHGPIYRFAISSDDVEYHAIASELLALRASKPEVEKLIEALAWIDHYEPELVASAEEKFEFKLTQQEAALASLEGNRDER